MDWMIHEVPSNPQHCGIAGFSCWQSSPRVVFFADLELNGMSSSDSPDIPPPLPLKGSMADYGNLLESQDLISPTTSPPAHQRVSAHTMIPLQLWCVPEPSQGRWNPEHPSAHPEGSVG